jgi:putative peptidoglycan lipid II flippase
VTGPGEGDPSGESDDSRSAIVRAGAMLSAAGVLSRALGWLRLIVITSLFGASRELDAYFVAFRLPDAIFQLLAGGVIGSVLVPTIARRIKDGTEAAWRAVSGVANVMLMALAALTFAAAVAAPGLLPFIAPGFDQQQVHLAVELTRLMLISPICFLLGAVATSVLHSRGRFAATAVAPIVYNAAIIAAALLLGRQMGVTALALGVAVGAICYLAVQLTALLAQTSYRHQLAGPRVPGAGSALAALAPRSLGLAGTQLVFIVNTALASTLGPGAVTAYTIAFTLLLIPVGLVGAPLGLVLFPRLSRAAADGSVEEFRRVMLGATRFTLWSGALLTGLGIVLHRPLVELLFGHGALADATLDTIAGAVVVMFAGIGAHSINLIALRAFYAWHDTRTPVLLALAQVGLTIAVGLAVVEPLGLPGLALAVALGSWAKAIALLLLLSGPRGLLDGRQLLPAGALSAVAALVAVSAAGAVALGVMVAAPTSVPEGVVHAAVLLAGGLAGTAAFIVVSRALGLAEAAQSLEMARVALRRS